MELCLGYVLVNAPLSCLTWVAAAGWICVCLQAEIELFVNRLDSVESVLPYEYDVWVLDTTVGRLSAPLGAFTARCFLLLGLIAWINVFAGSTFAKILRKEGLLKTLDRCCLGNGLSLRRTRWASNYKRRPRIWQMYWIVFIVWICFCFAVQIQWQ